MIPHLQVFVCLLLYGLSCAQAITIRDEVTETTEYPLETSTYRRSLAKSQNPSQRVPNHLQRVRNAFVYEDADDVIHVIEPPKHFQQLKILMQNRQKSLPPGSWEQHTRVRVAKPVVAKVSPKKTNHPNVRTTQKPLNGGGGDLEIQETEHLPVEILASVRKTENYLRKHKPKLPLAQQRVKTKKIQTVIWEKSQEHQQFVQGQEKKVQGIREFHNKNNHRRKFIKKRIKRQIPLAYQPLKGEDLLEHINELVRNASIYLENLRSYGDSADADEQTSTLQGEIFTRTSDPLRPQLREEDVIKILENSVKATDVIMDQIRSQSNFTNIPPKCEYSRGTSTSHIKSLKQQIECMQQVISVMKATKTQQETPAAQAPTPPNTTKRFGERLEVRKPKDLRQKPFLVANVDDEYFEDSSPSPLNTSLIYDDVMTTIRNLLHATNLQNLEDSTSVSSATPATTSSEPITAWDEIILPRDNSQEPVDFHNLNQYLNSLQTIVANLPQPSSNSSLNLHEIEGKPSKYYFINPEGGIYNLPQPFHHQEHRPPSPPSSIFRQFPDIPTISEYLSANGSPLKASQNVIEIL